MKNKQNLHIHTTYADGKDTPEEIILEAIDKGFDSIGFSEHSYMAFSDYPYQMSMAAMADYKNEVRALSAKYRDKIKLFCGLEFEFFSELQKCTFGAVISSDCHNKNFLDCHYTEAEELLRAAGFKSKWILTDSGFRQVSL